MLNRAPNVYVPVEPEDNGIAIPAVLSLIVHAAILVFIVFSHRVPDLDEPEPIETTLITPEELAAFQSNIAANREAMATQKQAQSVQVDSATETASNSQQNTSEDISARPVPINPRETSRPSSINAISPVEDSTPEPTPTQTSNPFGEEVADDDLLNKTADSNSADQSPVDETESDFAAEDNPYAKSGANGPKKSKGQIANDLLNFIKPKWKPDKKFVGTKITAYITVDENGNVLSVTTNAKDPELSNSLIKAIEDASPLTPIAGSGYTKLAPTFIVNKK